MNPPLSIVIPAYNEEKTIEALIARVQDIAQPLHAEIIVVDDGSSDGTYDVLTRHAHEITLLRHEKNKGKGAAVRTGFAHAKGEYIVVQDADLEYDPKDIVRMYEEARRKSLHVIFGSRRLPIDGHTNRGALKYYLGGVALTWATNLLYGTHLTDEPTCYKMLHRNLIAPLGLESNGFEFCPEVTAKVTRLGVPIYEIPIHYSPRNIAEGKKIRAKDGLIALATLLRYRFWSPKLQQKPE